MLNDLLFVCGVSVGVVGLGLLVASSWWLQVWHAAKMLEFYLVSDDAPRVDEDFARFITS